MKLIDADSLLYKIYRRFCKDCEKREGGLLAVIYGIDDAPCKRCKIVADMIEEITDEPSVDFRHHAH